MTLLAVPSPLWYADRATGAVAMLLLTTGVILGMGTTVRWKSQFWPKYISSGLHRNVLLLTFCFLAVHVLTAILDPFARLGWRDALVPFASWYRPFWLGLGVVAAELTIALALSSAIRPLIGFKIWRAIHWAGYATWPLALLHGLGIGDDVRMTWFLILQAACVIGTWISLVFWRLSFGWPRRAWPRVAASALSSFAVLVLALWVLNGPMAPGWALAAGTPITLLQHAHPAPTPPAHHP